MDVHLRRVASELAARPCKSSPPVPLSAMSSPPVPLSALRRGGTKFDTPLQPRTTSGPGPSHQRFMAITKQRLGATYEATIQGDLRSAFCSAAPAESPVEPA